MVPIIKVDMPSGKISKKCPSITTKTGVCIHNTANDASARNEIAYMQSNDNSVSFHFAVDHNEIIQGIDLIVTAIIVGKQAEIIHRYQ